MVKLFKIALFRVLKNTRRLQTYFSNAVRIVNDRPLTTLSDVRIVNDRPLTTLSDTPDDLKPLSPSSFLGQELALNTPVGGFYKKENLRSNYLYSADLAHRL